MAADPEVRAWAMATAAVQDALTASEPWPYGLDDEPWKAILRACADARCARETLRMWLEDMAFPEARPEFSIPGSQLFSSRPGEGRNTLRVLDLSDGWRLFILAGSAPARTNDGEPFSGGGVFVAREQDGVYRYRSDDDAGFDLVRQRRGWRVEQVGPCACGAHIYLTGEYRRGD